MSGAHSNSGSDKSISNMDTRFDVISISDKCLSDSMIKDISLNVNGRKLINQTTKDIPTLTLLESHNKNSKPLIGANIIVCSAINPHNAVLILTLKGFGANIRWCCNNPRLVNDEIASAVVCEGVPTFGSSSYDTSHQLSVMHQCVNGNNKFSPNIIIDCIGTMIEFIYNHYPNILKKIKGIIENNILDVPRDYVFDEATITFPIINVSSTYVQKAIRDAFNFQNYILNCIRLGRDILISGATIVIFGYGNRGSQIANILKLHGALVFIVEIDPICAFKASLNGFQVVKFHSVASFADVIITCTDNIHVLNYEKLCSIKDNCLIMNMGRSSVEIDTDTLYNNPSIIVKSIVENLVEHIIWPNGKKIILLAKGKHAGNACHDVPTELMAAAVTSIAVGVIELYMAPTSRYKPGMYVLPKKMNEYVASLFSIIRKVSIEHLTEEQAIFIGVNVKGPFKSSYYKY